MCYVGKLGHLACVLFEQDAMLECNVKVLVQYKVAHLFAVEWGNEVSAILLVTTIGSGSRYLGRHLALT